MRIIACLTSHNRREQTVATLASLTGQGIPIHVILVDAGSTDDTVRAVRWHFPEVHVVSAGPELYWSGGTRRAMREAVSQNADALLWLNDDTILRPGSLSAVLRTYEAAVAEDGGRPHVVVGTTVSPGTTQATYGGWKAGPWWRPLRLSRVLPRPQRAPCDTFNGNVVLIPTDAVAQVGILDDCWVHGGGDIDYGLRLSRAGVGIWVAPDIVGECALNNIEGTWQDLSLSFPERLRRLTAVKTLPTKQHYVLCRRWGGPFWPIAFASPYARLVASAFSPKVAALPARRLAGAGGRFCRRRPISTRNQQGS